ncbi:ABC transporter substrate-binding protein [Prosthecodimorpha staleyi]|uniref:ABC transporter substrate-binding protein n=1 Tax=Prosthecodimorpha staleyi TaxID=2840188 RepID=A0A947D4H4_9HYPH|nr:ABC transporter substrate-binding protein [Prosthecodimorpha staleyi]MBT9290656.1 ABC transporter substrate-binding protein [Prosthecodimorpha staleyi]
MVGFARRSVLALALAASVAVITTGWGAGTAAAAERLKVGVLKFGTVSWETSVIKTHGLDVAAGVEIEIVELASNDAARIAFQAGEVDTIVSDVLWAARLTAENRPVVYIPFSATEGSIMVAAGSPIRTLADLKGKKIGVAGGALDKGWLLIQGYARQSAGIDLTRDAEPVFGAPPLLQQKLETGELDAALLFWNFAARLEAKGFRELMPFDEAARKFGIEGNVSMLGYVFRAGFAAEHPAALKGLAEASRKAKALLAGSDAEWQRIRPQMRADDEATFQALRRRFLDGIPKRPVEAEQADARRLYAVLAEIGGERLVGPARTLPDGIYWSGLKGGS